MKKIEIITRPNGRYGLKVYNSSGHITLHDDFATATDVRAQIESILYEQSDEPPDVDDSVKYCPECETPNQFGEICARCERDNSREYC